MAMGKLVCDTPANHDPEKPNHMIIWLDVTIGNPKEYIHLKRAFGSNADPTFEAFIMLNDKDYHNLVIEGDAVTVIFEGVRFLLQAFDKEDKCLQAFEENQDKRIFFITSGQMGKNIVPKIMEQYRQVFTDLITNEPYPSVYVFCHDIERNLEWAMEYISYIQMFNFDSELLERLTRDIAQYFIERGKRIRQDNDLEGALQRLHWAKRLWEQYDKMQQNISTDNRRPVRESEGAKKIEKLIKEFEADLPKKSSSDSDDKDSDDEMKGSEPI